MKSHLWSLALVAAAAISGCATPSIHPLYSKDKEVAEPGIVGAWKPSDKNDKTIYTVSRDGPAYRMVVKDGDGSEPKVCDVRLVQLGKFRFADFSPTEKGAKGVDE